MSELIDLSVKCRASTFNDDLKRVDGGEAHDFMRVIWPRMRYIRELVSAHQSGRLREVETTPNKEG